MEWFVELLKTNQLVTELCFSFLKEKKTEQKGTGYGWALLGKKNTQEMQLLISL